MTKLVDFIYQRLRGRRLPENVPAGYLFGWAFGHAVQAVRGLTLLQCGAFQLPVFRGRRVTVRHRKNIRLGRGVRFEDGVRLDAFGGFGIELRSGASVGRNSLLSVSGVLSEPGTGIVVGRMTAIGSNNTLWGQGGIMIGDHCLLGPNVTVVSENHRSDRLDLPIRDQGSARDPVKIGDDCWIGANVTITAGVTIGDGAVVAANSAVVRDVGAFEIVGGVPSRVIGRRDASQKSEAQR